MPGPRPNHAQPSRGGVLSWSQLIKRACLIDSSIVPPRVLNHMIGQFTPLLNCSNVRLGSFAGVHTFRAIIPRTLHTIDSSSYGSVCQEQLIYSQWACERKFLPGEGIAAVAAAIKPVLGPVWMGWGGE